MFHYYPKRDGIPKLLRVIHIQAGFSKSDLFPNLAIFRLSFALEYSETSLVSGVFCSHVKKIKRLPLASPMALTLSNPEDLGFSPLLHYSIIAQKRPASAHSGGFSIRFPSLTSLSHQWLVCTRIRNLCVVGGGIDAGLHSWIMCKSWERVETRVRNVQRSKSKGAKFIRM